MKTIIVVTISNSKWDDTPFQETIVLIQENLKKPINIGDKTPIRINCRECYRPANGKDGVVTKVVMKTFESEGVSKIYKFYGCGGGVTESHVKEIKTDQLRLVSDSSESGYCDLFINTDVIHSVIEWIKEVATEGFTLYAINTLGGGCEVLIE